MVTDVEVATEVAIRGAAVCTMCIARKTGAPPLSVFTTLAKIGQRLKITDAVTRCDDCLQMKPTHRV